MNRSRIAALLVFLFSHSASAGVFQLQVNDESNRLSPCRVSIRSKSQSYIPTGAVTLPIFPDTWFMCDGTCQLELPDGEYVLRVEKGLEYRRSMESLSVNGRTSRTIRLDRWVNMKERGYSCAENHVHMDSVSLAPMLAAEGLDYGSSLTWWRGPDKLRPVPEGDGQVRLLEAFGRRIPTSIYDAELEYEWGAAYIQNLPNPLPLKAEPTRPNLDYLRYSVNAGATVHYQGGWSREVLLDALVGCVHVVNICNNNFGLHRFQPRSRYSNLLHVAGFPKYADTDVDMMLLNTDTYYRLLNCGLRLAVGAGTACGVKKAPVGYNRSYVECSDGTSLEEFNRQWRAGRNFVTNGPVIFLRTGQGHRPGDTIELAERGATVEVVIDVTSDQPLNSVQLIANGKIVKSQERANLKNAHLVHALPVQEGTWIAARCTATDDWLRDAQLAEYENDGNPKNPLAKPSRLRFAHTSPIYIRVDKRDPVVRESIDEGLKMLDALEAFAKQTASEQYLGSFLSELDRAREILRRRK